MKQRHKLYDWIKTVLEYTRKEAAGPIVRLYRNLFPCKHEKRDFSDYAKASHDLELVLKSVDHILSILSLTNYNDDFKIFSN